MKPVLKALVFALMFCRTLTSVAQYNFTKLKKGYYYSYNVTKLSNMPDTNIWYTLIHVRKVRSGKIREGIAWNNFSLDYQKIGKGGYTLYSHNKANDSFNTRKVIDMHYKSGLYFYNFSCLNDLVMFAPKAYRKGFMHYEERNDSTIRQWDSTQPIQVFWQNDKRYYLNRKSTDGFMDVNFRWIEPISQEVFDSLKQDFRRKVSQRTKKTQKTTVTVTHLDSNRYYLVDYWFIGCHPCYTNAPKFKALYTLIDTNKVKMIGYNPFNTEKSIQFYKKKNKVEYLLVSSESKVHYPFLDKGVTHFPTYYLLNEKFEIIESYPYELGDEKFVKMKKDLEKYGLTKQN